MFILRLLFVYFVVFIAYAVKGVFYVLNTPFRLFKNNR